MAGAVSAGAYTAGFMDYILEALELWDKKKVVYNLAGVSGKTIINHPEAQRMLYDIKRGHIENLIFSKIGLST